MNFSNLVQNIRQTHTALQQEMMKAINRSLTIRNWLIGYYIFEFEQKGKDRAKYGSKLLSELARKVNEKSLSETNLKICRQFYTTYPQILKSIRSNELGFLDQNTLRISIMEIGQTVSDQFQDVDNQLLNRLSYSHFMELLPITDLPKRFFYEAECIKGNWSVRELRRQINSLYYERSILSKNPEELAASVINKAETLKPADIVKSVYAFEFLGLHAKDVVEESDLEIALLDNLQNFMLELGHGYCLEARQKRMLIGNEYFFIDLVFYHRILKCHVLVDVKIEEFTHANAGQLNTYLNYYKKEVLLPGDNPPVGILLVTNKNETLVEYATAGMDNQLFVSKYLVELPSREQLEKLIQKGVNQL
jgi:predicted nuclease of restriction endonuclease-like (RecB) superfamily